MKALIYIMMLASPFALSAEDTEQNKRKKIEWYQQVDERLSSIENTITIEIDIINQKQDQLNGEMIRLNEKLENRFDKYFLWGYGTILVILSTILNVAFNKKKEQQAANSE
jgi:hypothetical protein